MAEDGTQDEDRRNAVERLLARDLEEVDGVGSPLSRRARQTRRSVEAYLQAGVRPRWMERLGEIDAGIAKRDPPARARVPRAARGARRRPARVLDALARPRAILAFDDVNELIRQHNEWFPIERQLPIDPRTRDYVLVGGRPYRRAELGPEWVLEKFPA